jgi:ATP-dependent DNA helicase PIF1
MREGTFEKAPDDRLPAPPELALKKAAQVMFVRNDPERRWVNGTLGIVKEIHDAAVLVRLEDGSTFDVERVEWQDVRYALDDAKKSIVEEVAGTYVQFPLMPAWAVTIHKAQGLTLSRVLVDLDRGAFAAGQVYVALSRCQTLEGLSLRRAVRVHEVRASEEARGFYDRMRRR